MTRAIDRIRKARLAARDARDEYGRRTWQRDVLDKVAAEAWTESRGHMATARWLAVGKLRSAGFGYIEIVILIYYLLKIWKLLREMNLLEVTPEEIAEAVK
jgi:hypothetical protein